MGTEQTFVIVGAGLAGAKAAQTLREEGFTGQVILCGEEAERPYERPPLSKGYLQGTEERAKIFVHDEGWYADNSVDLRVSAAVTGLDLAAHQIELDGGERVGYDKLLLAPGASPRPLRVPGADLDGVYLLRKVGDADRLGEALRAGGRVTVVGAGWIGLETAAAARGHGCAVTVVEPQPAPLYVALGQEMGEFFAAAHRAQGVELRLGSGVTEIHGEGGKVSAVVLDDGTRLPSDTVIVGVGAAPNTALAERAGLAVDDGILVDESLRTADPDVYAAGDVASARHPRYGRHLRVEHWSNALHSGPAAARAMLGQDVTYDRIPYFFTDQYDIGMEFLGWFPPGGYDRVVTRGDVEGQAFHAFWLAGDRVVAGMHVNRWDEGIAPVEELIRSGKPLD
ncbi:NAD(P)/FAD-dependent oxidoreductase [Amycolatopsis suaedae]|uniref:NAD(P)/FAD-dependent oxidoreductase n=1 Tax=Amycolatopsis suaedae TaxID=2510978 RepID=A0A4Q7JBY1_9PSEU|nr:FAD-dependent oxidoreductase [Amycolatopsis suaedae]RZQ64618.1 NAD(P)/FAD-dependent oxidoreductase [Amycolatopsis suaedae]